MEGPLFCWDLILDLWDRSRWTIDARIVLSQIGRRARIRDTVSQRALHSVAKHAQTSSFVFTILVFGIYGFPPSYCLRAGPCICDRYQTWDMHDSRPPNIALSGHSFCALELTTPDCAKFIQIACIVPPHASRLTHRGLCHHESPRERSGAGPKCPCASCTSAERQLPLDHPEYVLCGRPPQQDRLCLSCFPSDVKAGPPCVNPPRRLSINCRRCNVPLAQCYNVPEYALCTCTHDQFGPHGPARKLNLLIIRQCLILTITR
ncbi:hypothetical protein BC629DRAFT_599134 [Irpex lacteus]|nr:hypothetical protein BC629DRAFT_599134 [Irpex lacteus]